MRNYYLPIFLFFLLFGSCSQEIDDTSSVSESDVIIMGIDYSEKIKNHEIYTLEDNYSHLWNENDTIYSVEVEPTTKAALAIPYQAVESLGTQKMAYSSVSGICETRSRAGVVYLMQKYLYSALVAVPKGSYLILPPTEVMNTYTPMGFYPSSNGDGYDKTLVNTTSTHEYYKLSTQIWYITHDISGARVAPDNNPIYHNPCKQNGAQQNLLFYYQIISNIEW